MPAVLAVALASPLVPGRDHDVVGFGVAQGILSDDLKYTSLSPQEETLFELYYNVRLTGAVHVTLGLQVIDRPGGLGGDEELPDATACYVRVQCAF